MTSTAEQILDCAHSLIVERGYNGFSYADIAERVGIRKPSIHHHFPAKAELGRAVVRRYRDQLRAMMHSVAGSDPVQQLEGYIDYWESCIRNQANPFCVCAMLAAEMPALPEAVSAEVRDHFKDVSEWMSALLIEGAGQGRFVLNRSPVTEANCFTAVVHGGMLAARALGDSQAFGAVARSALCGLVKK
jgi:TetR/AcrR family transcriptional regulator, transcriptional repressor for nem operon